MAAAPDKVRLLMLHPTLSDRDQQVELVRVAKAFYTGKLTLPAAAHWFVRLEDISGRWRLQSQWKPAETMWLPCRPAPGRSGSGQLINWAVIHLHAVFDGIPHPASAGFFMSIECRGGND